MKTSTKAISLQRKDEAEEYPAYSMLQVSPNSLTQPLVVSSLNSMNMLPSSRREVDEKMAASFSDTMPMRTLVKAANWSLHFCRSFSVFLSTVLVFDQMCFQPPL